MLAIWDLRYRPVLRTEYLDGIEGVPRSFRIQAALNPLVRRYFPRL